MHRTKRKPRLSLFVLVHICVFSTEFLCTCEYMKVRKFAHICAHICINYVYKCAWTRVCIGINMRHVHGIQILAAGRGMNSPFFTTWHITVIWTIRSPWRQNELKEIVFSTVIISLFFLFLSFSWWNWTHKERLFTTSVENHTVFVQLYLTFRQTFVCSLKLEESWKIQSKKGKS